MVMEWYRYVSQVQMTGKSNWYQVPLMGASCESLLNHQLCTKGMQLVMGIRAMHLKRIQRFCKRACILPEHKLKGTVSLNWVKNNDARLPDLMRHLECLLELGEARATCVVATMVDRVAGHENRSEEVDMVYLPILMGFWYYYKWYMAGFECKVRSNAKGATIVEGVAGNSVDKAQFILMSTYFYYASATSPSSR